MSKEKRRVPKLRFPGFTEDWEQCKLSDLTQLITKGTTPKVKNIQNGVNFIKVENISDDGVISINSYVSEEEHMNFLSRSILSNNDILFSIAGTLGRTAIVKSHLLPANTNQALAIIRLNKSVDVVYINTFLKSNAIKTYIRKNPTVGAQPNLSLGQVSDLEINIPSYNEQEKISNLFSKFDLMITLHQRKLDNLKLKKKALLQKLFPKNGERYPELRFPGFTDAWEQRKLGDFYTFKNGLNKEKVYFGYGDSIVNFTDVFHNRQIYSSTLKGKVCVNKKELENYKVKEGDLFFTRTSETIDEIGFPAVVMEPMERVVFSGFVLRGRAEKYDPLVNIFKSYIFFTNNFRSEMKKKSSMTTRALTSGTALKEMYFSYPKDLEEQTKIGEILLRLDKIITLHQRKLDHLQLQKKALLQQMFV